MGEPDKALKIWQGARCWDEHEENSPNLNHLTT